MEKIQLALERARQERRQVLGGDAGVPADSFEPGLAGAEIPLPLVATDSPERLRRHRIVAAEHQNEASRGVRMAIESFRMLRAQVLQRLKMIGGQTVAVTSPHQGDGKTLVAINLALTIAKHIEQGAMLIEGDLRRPTVHKYLGVRTEYDISNYLAGGAPLEACLARPRMDHLPGLDNLIVLLQQEPLHLSSEFLASGRAGQLFSECKRLFPDHIIIVDCPPILSAEDPLIIQQYVDGTVLVVQEGITTKTDLRRSAELIGEERYLGAVLNNSTWNTSAYYY